MQNIQGTSAFSSSSTLLFFYFIIIHGFFFYECRKIKKLKVKKKNKRRKNSNITAFTFEREDLYMQEEVDSTELSEKQKRAQL